MTTHLSREPELMVRYPAVNPFGRIVGVVLLSMLIAALLWIPLLAVNQLLSFVGLEFDPCLVDPSATWPLVALVFIILIPAPLMLGWFLVRYAVCGLKMARGSWWLRLSPRGFEVNDRLGRTRRHDGEIEKFMLVAPSAHVEDAVLLPPTTCALAFDDSEAGIFVFRVGYHLSPGCRGTLANRLRRRMGGLCDRDGTRADGLVMG